MAGGFDGNGTYNRYYNWTQDAANGIPIMASRVDTEDSGFAAALSICITRDGQGKPTADIPWNNKKITNLADATGTQDAMNQRTSDARYAPINYRLFKAANTARSSTSTAADDPDLISGTLNAGTYEFILSVQFNATSSGAGGIKLNVHYSGTTTLTVINVVYAANGTGAVVNGGYGSFGADILTPPTISVSTFRDWAIYKGLFTATTSGVFSLQWAQNTPNVNAANLLAGSHLIINKVA